MENIIIDELTKKKLSTWKRLLIFFLDSLMVIALFLILFYLLGTFLIKKIASSSIDGINEIYALECEKQKAPYEIGLYNIYQLDKDAYLEAMEQNNPDMDFDTIMENYNNLYYAIDTNIQSYDGYSEYYQGFSATYYIILLSSLFIASFIFLLLIPLTNKKNKTITMMLTKTSLVDDKTNILCKNTRVAVRFLSIFALELAMAYAIVQFIGCLFIGLINIVLISITKKKKTIHDFLTQCHVEKDEYSYTE